MISRSENRGTGEEKCPESARRVPRNTELRCIADGCGETFKQNTVRAVRFCPKHRLADIVLISGQTYRYCTQCSRAHQLSRFVGDSKVCKPRLWMKRENSKHCSANMRRTNRESPGRWDEIRPMRLGCAVHRTKRPPTQSRLGLGGTGKCSKRCHDSAHEDEGSPCFEHPCMQPMPDANFTRQLNSRSMELEEAAAAPTNPDELSLMGKWWTQVKSLVGADTKVEHVLSTWSHRKPTTSSFFPHGEISGTQPDGIKKARQRSWGFNTAMKLRGATPASVPADMGSHVRTMLRDDTAELMGSIRPGCVHFSLDVWCKSAEEAEKALQSFHDALVSMSPEMPWSQFATTVLLGDQCFELRDGKVSHRRPRSCPVEILSAAPVDQEPHVLQLAVVTENGTNLDDYQLLLRINGEFIELETYEVQPLPGGILSMLARPADCDCEFPSGMAWVEFASRAGMNEFSVSPAVPLFLSTDFPEAALDLASFERDSPGRVPATELKNIADVLHPLEEAPLDVTLCARLMRWAATRGLHSLLEALIQAAEEFCLVRKVLSLADSGNMGMLSLAAGSGDVATVASVCDWMCDESTVVDPCQLRGPLKMSALHWAALQAHEEVLVFLGEEFPGVRDAMHSLQGGPGPVRMTPADVYTSSKQGLFTREELQLSGAEGPAGSATSMADSTNAILGRLKGPPVWRRLPWLFLLFAPMVLFEARMPVDAICALVLALVADGIAKYSARRRIQYIERVVVPKAAEAGIVSAEDGPSGGVASLLNQFDMSQPGAGRSWGTLMGRLCGYWSPLFVGCVSSLMKCSKGAQTFWLAWLAGTLLLSVLLVVASTHLETIRAQKIFNMTVMLAMQAVGSVTLYTQPDPISPMLPPPEHVMSICESLSACATLGLVLGLWYCLAYGLAPLWTATASMMFELFTVAKDFQELHFGRALPFTSYLLLGIIRMMMFHMLWIHNERKLLLGFVSAKHKLK